MEDAQSTGAKVAHVVLEILTFILIGGGFGILGFLGIQVYKNPSLKLTDLSRDFTSSPVSERSTAYTTEASTPLAQPVSSQSAQQITPIPPEKFKTTIQEDTKKVFSDPKYSSLVSVIDQATAATSPDQEYSAYKSAFDLMQAAYKQTGDSHFKIVMAEIIVYSVKLPGFNQADMKLPS